jgi:hypothetical protein
MMEERDGTIYLNEHDLHAEDWENALHRLLWAKGQEDLFFKIRDKAMAIMKRRMQKQITKSMLK